ncbi:YggS family pyridoxal phosphate-dependent enzyme [Methylobacillus flagellatus]|uniref:YggS family pyridoxal phosphate-dependent enzyme n=1 Tax=Methylobacillus flagellatus TaxID=405 RepID=UPI0010F5BA68|nr:YggS family pyridoxal phosphate-dependent enzyme [Methylobacillus flagellatus]
MSAIASHLQAVNRAIADACKLAGRTDRPALLAVSKTQPASALREAYAAGQVRFGENYVQEAINKQAELGDLAIEWHFIGPIQSNKTQLIAQHFDWVHSVDRLKIAQRLSSARSATPLPLNVCIQVNVSLEASKSGVSSSETLALAETVASLPGLRLRGLMAIPAPTDDIREQRAQFHAVRTLFDQLQATHPALDTLSIGMSQDYPAAIAEGATIVRIGTAIFGARSPHAISTPPSVPAQSMSASESSHLNLAEEQNPT